MPFHSFVQDGEGWKTLEEKRVYSSPFMQVQEMKVQTPTRPQGAHWTVVHRKAACVVVPVLENGDFLLIRQERVPVRQALWEFPAGQIDVEEGDFDRSVARNGVREMQEETGYELAPGFEIIRMGHFFTSPGMTDEVCHLMLARGVTPSPKGTQHDKEEAITECRAVSPSKLKEMIGEGRICDANSLAAFARMVAMGLL